jgi:hypothetical protein
MVFDKIQEICVRNLNLVQIIRDTSFSIYDFEVDLVFNRPVDIQKISILKDLKIEVINKNTN